jgi:chemotaxis-related protein WspD
MARVKMSRSNQLTNARGSAADRLLDREAPEDYVRIWTEHVAAEKKSIEPGTRSIVIFRIGTEWLALPTQIFQEVAEDCTVHMVPGVGREVLNGLVNIHGELLLCVSLEKILGIQLTANEGHRIRRIVCKRLMVCNREGDRLAFPVQEIRGLDRYHPRELREVPSTLSKAATHTIGILPRAGNSVGCLDDQLLFYALNKGLS